MFYKKLYASPKLKNKRRRIAWKIKHGKLMPNIYVITLSNGNNLLEFYQSFQLKQPYYENNMPYIVGIANGYTESVELVTKILSDVFEKTGSYDVRKYCFGE